MHALLLNFKLKGAHQPQSIYCKRVIADVQRGTLVYVLSNGESGEFMLDDLEWYHSCFDAYKGKESDYEEEGLGSLCHSDVDNTAGDVVSDTQ